MEKEPWQEDIYESQEEETRSERRHRNQDDSGILANRILTVLAILFFCDCCWNDSCIDLLVIWRK